MMLTVERIEQGALLCGALHFARALQQLALCASGTETSLREIVHNGMPRTFIFALDDSEFAHGHHATQKALKIHQALLLPNSTQDTHARNE
jgi:hypothetical protein